MLKIKAIEKKKFGEQFYFIFKRKKNKLKKKIPFR